MKRVAIVTSLVSLLCLSTGAAGLGVRLDDCTALPPDAQLFKSHPELAVACDSIVQIDGQRYLRMNAELKQNQDDLLVLRFKGTTRDMALSPGAAEPLASRPDGRLPQDLPVGSPLKVYVPQSGVLDVFADSDGSNAAPVPVGIAFDEPVEQRIATYTCCPRRRPWYPVPEFLPVTAAPLPVLGLIGVGMLGAGALLRLLRLRRR